MELSFDPISIINCALTEVSGLDMIKPTISSRLADREIVNALICAVTFINFYEYICI
jgi:hypothetical protein